jgi:antitoxin HigA-1
MEIFIFWIIWIITKKPKLKIMFKFHTISHPCETLKELYLDNCKISTTQLAKILGVTRPHMSNFLNGKVNISPEFALRLAKAFDTTPELWLNLQRNYDLWKLHNSQTKLAILAKVEKIDFAKLEHLEIQTV